MNSLRTLIYLPLYFSHWIRILSAREQGDWAKVAMILERVQKHGIRNSDTHFWLGTAYLHLDRWNDALDQFEAIDKCMHDPSEEGSRIVNHAIAFYRLGQIGKCRSMLESAQVVGWRDQTRKRRVNLLEKIALETDTSSTH